MTRHSFCAVSFAVLITMATFLPTQRAAAQAAAPPDGGKARAMIKDAQGKNVGEATLTQVAHGVIIRAELSGLPPGPHGFHIHAVGKCDPPSFTSAGGHFNPTSHKHGYNAAAGPHSGDLPNVIAATDGKAVIEVWVSDIALGGGQVAAGTSAPGRPSSDGAQPASSGSNDLLGRDGTALVVHARMDDYATDPAGNSGDRIACGVIQR